MLGTIAHSLKLQHSRGSWKEAGKENQAKSRLHAQPRIGVTGRRRFRFGVPRRQSAGVPAASREGSAAFQKERPRDDLRQPENPRLSKGLVRQCN